MNEVATSVSDVILNIGEANFGRSMLKLLNDDFGVLSVAAYERDDDFMAPRIVFSAAHDRQLEDSVNAMCVQWQTFEYKEDPFLNQLYSQVGPEPTMRLLDLPNSDLRRYDRHHVIERYYDEFGMSDEISYGMRVGRKTINTSYFRSRDAARLTPEQLNSLRELSAFVLSTVRKHASLKRDTEQTPDLAMPRSEPASQDRSWLDTRQDRVTKLRSALLMDRAGLTVREAEICAYIVSGHTVLGISLMLDISTNTVATHRKRAYSKLGLSSQTELFQVCLKHCI